VALLVLALRLTANPLFMPYMGARHEGRVLGFHLLIGLGLGLASSFSRNASGRWQHWAGLGTGGAFVSWSLDYAYTYGHRIDTAVWYLLEFSDPGSSFRRSFGILQILRYLGPVLFLGAAAIALEKNPMAKLRVICFAILALAMRFPILAYQVSWEWIFKLPISAFFYFLSVLSLLYGLGHVDESSTE
jgi:hypothetical protein